MVWCPLLPSSIPIQRGWPSGTDPQGWVCPCWEAPWCILGAQGWLTTGLHALESASLGWWPTSGKLPDLSWFPSL